MKNYLSGKYRESDTYLMEYANELTIALKACVAHHRTILSACQLTELFLNPIILAKSFQLMWQICNLAYAATEVCLFFFYFFSLGFCLFKIISSDIGYTYKYTQYVLFGLDIFGSFCNWFCRQFIEITKSANWRSNITMSLAIMRWSI